MLGGTRGVSGPYATQVFVSISVAGSPLLLDPNPITNADDCMTGQAEPEPWDKVC